MPVDSRHPLYDFFHESWTQCRDAYDGPVVVKSKNTTYLRPLDAHRSAVSDSENSAYLGYLDRALFVNYTGRTVDGLAGAIFQNPPTVSEKTPAKLKDDHAKDITLNAQALESFAAQVGTEIIKTGRYGILIDMPSVESPDPRPYWVGFRAEDITNWRTEVIDGKTVTTLVVLYQPGLDKSDPFEHKTVEQYRVLSLVGGVYTSALWRKKAKAENAPAEKDEWEIVEVIVPTRREEPFTEIPFIFVNPNSIDADPVKPPLIDLVVTNFSHYKGYADLKHALHYLALPTPWIAGNLQGMPPGAVVTLGANCLMLGEGSSAGMLEFQGSGLGAIQEDLKNMVNAMATLGARLIETVSDTQQTATEVQFRHGGDHATLRTIAGALELALSAAMKWHEWMVTPTKKDIDDCESGLELNKDFFATKMSPTELAGLVSALQADAISYKTFYALLRKGFITRPDVDDEQEQKDIETDVERRMARMPDITEEPGDEKDEDKKTESKGNAGGAPPNNKTGENAPPPPGKEA